MIGEDSRFRTAAPGGFRFAEERERATLDFQGVRYEFPALVIPALRFIVAQEEFGTADLPDLADAALRLGLLRHLHGIGFLRLD